MYPYRNKKAPLPPKFPVREWLGKYEAYLINMYGRLTYRYHYPRLERFFAFFSSEQSLEWFTAVEIADYVQWRLRCKITRNNILVDLSCIRRFFRWCIQEKGLNLLNPVFDGHNKKLRNPSGFKPQSIGSGFTKVEIPASDERSPVHYDDIYDILS
jgi:hypothetical protein